MPGRWVEEIRVQQQAQAEGEDGSALIGQLQTAVDHHQGHQGGADPHEVQHGEHDREFHLRQERHQTNEKEVKDDQGGHSRIKAVGRRIVTHPQRLGHRFRSSQPGLVHPSRPGDLPGPKKDPGSNSPRARRPVREENE